MRQGSPTLTLARTTRPPAPFAVRGCTGDVRRRSRLDSHRTTGKQRHSTQTRRRYSVSTSLQLKDRKPATAPSRVLALLDWSHNVYTSIVDETHLGEEAGREAD